MPDVRIVRADEGDLPAIMEMIRGLAEYEKLTHLLEATPDRLREALFGTKPAAEVVLAYLDAECAGLALFYPTFSSFLCERGLYLEDLYVKPHVRGQGVGLALLRHLAETALERNCGRLEWGVLRWNAPAIAFYKGLGAEPVDEWVQYRLRGEPLQVLAAR